MNITKNNNTYDISGLTKNELDSICIVISECNIIEKRILTSLKNKILNFLENG